jgi:hypothetical protein
MYLMQPEFQALHLLSMKHLLHHRHRYKHWLPYSPKHYSHTSYNHLRCKNLIRRNHWLHRQYRLHLHHC